MRLVGRRAGRTRVAALWLLAATGLLSGCTNFSQLQFHNDHDVTFSAPASRAKLTLPITLQWQVSGFRIAAPGSEPPSKDAGYFALFVDRAPIRPGQTLAAVGHNDPSCDASAGCPDKQYLADRQIYTTTGLSYTLRQVAALSDNSDNWQLHDVTIVLLDTTGHRIGEHAYYRDFQLRRSSDS
ncbi:MAG TPA: hypothetical protein VHC43_14425 [Mycobacteriales bacterium]|nr:hypothetical protein [Mycobacteriales bacterium]